MFALRRTRLRDGVGASDRIATLRLRWKSVAEKRVIEESRDLRGRDFDRDWQDASANFDQAALAGAFAEKLKETAATDDFGWRSLRREAARLDDERGRNRTAGDRRRGGEEPRERPRNPRLDED